MNLTYPADKKKEIYAKNNKLANIMHCFGKKAAVLPSPGIPAQAYNEARNAP